MRNTTRKGCTLIELLIVVVIIGILAAIAIPKFANTKEKAYLASMKSDLRNMATVEEGYFSDFQVYTTGTGSNVGGTTATIAGFVPSAGVGGSGVLAPIARCTRPVPREPSAARRRRSPGSFPRLA